MQIVKKQKALEPKTSKKTNSPRAKKKVFSIDNSSNRDIEEDRKKAYNFEKECTFTTFVFVILNCVDGYFDEVKLKRNYPEPRADKYKLI